MSILSALLTSIVRELRFLRRNYWDLAIVSVIPIALIALVGGIFSASVPRQLPVVIADADRSAFSRELIRYVGATSTMQVVEVSANLDELRASMRQGKAYLGLYIPQGSEFSAASGRRATVYAFLNDSYYTVANLALRDTNAAISQFNGALTGAQASATRAVYSESAKGPPVRVSVEMLFNSSNSYEWGLSSSVFPAVLHLAFCSAIIVALIREMSAANRSSWIADAGGSLTTAIFAKVFLYALIYLGIGVLSLVWLRWRGWPVNGSVLMLLLGQAAMYFAYGSICALIVGVLRGNVLMALSFVALLANPALTYGNVLFPIEAASWFVKVIGVLMPYSPYMQLQAQQMQMGAPAAYSIKYLLHLALFIVIAFPVSRIAIGWALRFPTRKAVVV